MKHFFNDKLMAANVMTVDIDVSMTRELLRISRDKSDRRKFAVASPPWNSDIIWVSARSTEAFFAFQAVFDRLAIAEHVEPYLDLEKAVRLYSGFLVERSICKAPNFHVDWIDTNNEAFTLLTPLTDNADGFGLLYKKSDGTIGEYSYKVGEALIIGEGFEHSTKPGRSAEPVVLLSFAFGSDKMEHWQNIARTAADQGDLVRRPDGTFQRVSRWTKLRKALGKSARAAIRSWQKRAP